MLTDSRLNGAQQELLRGMFRHTVVATAVANNGDDLGHTHQSAECLVGISALFEQLELLGGLREYLYLIEILKSDDIVRAHALLNFVSVFIHLLFVETTKCQCTATRCGFVLTNDELHLTALCHILQSLLVASSGNSKCLESVVDGRNAHIHIVGHEHVLEVQHVLGIALHLHAWSTVGVIHQIVSVA